MEDAQYPQRSIHARRRSGTIAAKIARSDRALFALFAVVVVAMANLNAVVDVILHRELEYLDAEHLIVGGVTGLVSAVLFGALVIYVRHLRSALDRIRTLEGLLPICASCKKVRTADATPGAPAEWASIESYLTENTEARLSHGLCPDCLVRLYPEYAFTE